MAKSTSEITIGQNGSIYVAPVGTTAPSDIETAWAAEWIDLGFANDDGVTFRDSKTTEPISVWQLFYAARHIVTGRETSVSFVLRQWNGDTITLAFGGGTITPTVGPPAHYLYVPPDPEDIDERALGVEWLDGTKIYRLVLGRVMVTEGVETNLTRTAAAGSLPITAGVLGVDGAAPWSLRTNDPAFAA